MDHSSKPPVGPPAAKRAGGPSFEHVVLSGDEARLIPSIAALDRQSRLRLISYVLDRVGRGEYVPRDLLMRARDFVADELELYR